MKLHGAPDFATYQELSQMVLHCRLWEEGRMKYRVAGWAAAGLLVAAVWGIYFARRNKEIPIDPIVSFLARLICPIAILGSHFAISLYWVLVANLVTYALVGAAVEMLRRLLSRPS